ncbi:hypothetical protein [Bradyrhizobium sp. USDA 4454]
MENSADLDHRHTLAIVREIGDRLRSNVVPDPQLPDFLESLIERLRDLDRPTEQRS